LVDLSLNVLPSLASSTPCSTKAPSACIVQRDTYGYKRSSENILLASARVLLVWRGQPSHERLPPLLGCLKVNCRAKGGINQRLDGSEGCSRGRENMLPLWRRILFSAASEKCTPVTISK